MNASDRFIARIGAATGWLAALICCGVVTLAWFAYRAAAEWRRSSTLLVDRRAHEMADLLVTALGRDMRAVQASVLDSRDWSASSLDAPYEIDDLLAVAFARYPYPACFFAWRDHPDQTLFFARSDRLPSWLPAATRTDRYPVEVLQSPRMAAVLRARVARDAAARRPYTAFEVAMDGVPYQVVARTLFADSTRTRPTGGLGFLVDLEWVRQHYFRSITEQVAQVAQVGDGLTIAIVDDRGLPVVAARERDVRDTNASRTFPLMFFDPMIVALDPSPGLIKRTWSVRVGAAADPTLAIAATGARRTLIAVAAAALALGVGLVIAVRAARVSAEVALMRSDFVSTVTHELKTPVSVVRGIGESLIRGRVTTPERLREYAQLLVQEGHRLSRLIDNLLAYSRVTDVADVYSFEPQRPADVAEEALKGFRRLLHESGFRMVVDVPATLPAIRADRTALVLALDNLIDNAIRYSDAARDILLQATAGQRDVEFAVIDHGHGIPAEDLARVQRRFVRGRSANGHGSGLGLAIVSRIAHDHGGAFRIESTANVGTTAVLSIPQA